MLFVTGSHLGFSFSEFHLGMSVTLTPSPSVHMKAKWPIIPVSAQSGRSYKKIVDCEQSRLVWTIHSRASWTFATWQFIGQMVDAGR